MLVVGDMVRLGRGEQQRLDLRPEQPREQAARAVTKAPKHGLQRLLRVLEHRAPAVQAAQQIDQHDLAVEAAEVIRVERPHHPVPVVLEPIAHHMVQPTGHRLTCLASDRSSDVPRRPCRPAWSCGRAAGD